MTRWLCAALAAVLLTSGIFIGYLVSSPANPIWAPVVAAIGASALTAIAALGVERVRARHAALGQQRAERREAYVEMLKAAAIFITIATTIRGIRQLSTGRPPAVRLADPLDFLVRFRRDLEPLWNAWSLVLLHGSQAAITAANQLIDAAAPTMGLASAKGEARSGLASWLLGETWTAEQEKAFARGLGQVGKARLAFAAVARKEIGAETADLLSGTGARDSQPE